jgi:putative transposase
MAEAAVLEAETTEITKGRAPGQKYKVPEGWVARGFAFEVEWPGDELAVQRIRSHFGARRKAYNWALGQVKADMDARKLDRSHASVRWNLYELRKRWNTDKVTVAPWWADNSKEAYATGITDLCTALKNWQDSKSGKRNGKRVGFPGFRAARRDHGRVRFTTGMMRAEPDRRTVRLPVVGSLRSKESTRRLERLTARGRARILSATLSERWGRLFVSFSCIVRNHDRPEPGFERAGVDLGLRTLATIADTEGTSGRSPTRLRSGQHSPHDVRPGGRCPGASAHHEATATRKPSSPVSTADASTCTCASRRRTTSPRCWRQPTARS